MYTVIEVKCTDQEMTLMDVPVISSGDVQTDKVHFEFCSKWDGMVKTAVFYRDGIEPINRLIDENDEVLIPQEVLNDSGVFYFGVLGVKDNCKKTSEVLKYKLKKGATDGRDVPEPTPDIYSQILTKIEEAGILFTRATEAEITSILGNGAEGTNVVTVSRLNQFKKGYDTHFYTKSQTYSKTEIDNKCSLSETGTTYTYTGG